MGHIVGTKGLELHIFVLSHEHNDSNHQDKTNAYGVLVIQYEIVPKTLSNMK